jgi:CheY-like chemotaxis protein
MGSEIKVTSALGQGSIFWFDVIFPVTQAVKAQTATVTRNIIGYQGNQKTVLIADDKEPNRLLLLDLLEPLGFKVIQAENGEEEVTQAVENKPDIILTDLVMPVMSGFEAIEKLRQLPATQQIPIIAISASSLERERHRLIDCDFVPKPIDEQHLFALIAKHLALEWILSESSLPQPTKIVEKSVDTAEVLPILPPEILEELYELAIAGKMRGIREKATQLAAMEVQYQAIASQLQELAVNFEDEQILTLIEKCRR